MQTGKFVKCEEVEPTIHERLSDAGIRTESHESDLYVHDTIKVREILAYYEFPGNITSFRSQIDGQLWLDIPFANDKWWDKRRNQ